MNELFGVTIRKTGENPLIGISNIIMIMKKIMIMMILRVIRTFFLYLLPTRVHDILEKLLTSSCFNFPLNDLLLPHLLRLDTANLVDLLFSSQLFGLEFLEVFSVASAFFFDLSL